MSRVPAGDRVRRLLALVPWLTANSPVAVAEVCARFGLSERQLLAELQVLSFVGIPPYTPDTMISVDIDDDLIEVRLAEPFDRPLRLSPAQALALIAAGESIRKVPGADPGDPLQRALAKVSTALGVDSDRLHIEVGEGERSTLESLSEAVIEHRQVQLSYFSHGRNEHSVRRVNPYRLYAREGHWYLLAWCQRSEDTRVFRVDRIDELEIGDETFEPPAETGELVVFQPSDRDPRVTLDLDASARWVIEQYPNELVEESEDGTARVRLAVSARPWLERLLLRLGPAGRVVEAEGDLGAAGAEAARRVLARYGED